MRTFHLLVANTLIASVTNNFLWFCLTFWVYLETRSVLATAIVGGGYMLLVAISGMFFGTFGRTTSCRAATRRPRRPTTQTRSPLEPLPSRLRTPRAAT